MRGTESPHVQAFVTGKDPVARGVLTAALTHRKFFIEGVTLPVCVFVKRKVDLGWSVQKTPQKARRLVSPAGKIRYDETEITRTGMDYAEFLLEKRRSR